MTDLRTLQSTDRDPVELCHEWGSVLAEFGPATQDSGNDSWLVEADGVRLFVKTAGHPGRPAPGAPVPYFDHDGRVRLLRNAVEVARSCVHAALPALVNVIESPVGPALVYEAATGELVHARGEQRADPASAYQRFARLPAPDLLAIFETLLDLHVALAAQGWVAADLYDGCLIVDFEGPVLTVVDLDTYRRGPTRNTMGRMFGSSTFMAPEEFELGARIDQRTTVFTLGRLVWHFGTRLSEDSRDFCGGDDLATVVAEAVRPEPQDRHADVAAFVRRWHEARTASDKGRADSGAGTSG